MLKPVSKENIYDLISRSLPFLMGIFALILYEFTNTSGLYWTHINSIHNPGILNWHLTEILFEKVYLLSKIIIPDHPMYFYQIIMSCIAALTCAGATTLSIQNSRNDVQYPRDLIIPVVIALFFTISPFFWLIANQGHFLLFGACLIIWSLVLWNRFFLLDHSRWNAYFGSVIFGVCIGLYPPIAVMITMPITLGLLKKLRYSSSFNIDLKLIISIIFYLLIGFVGAFLVTVSDLGYSGLSSFSWSVSETSLCSSPLIIHSGIQQLSRLIRENIGIPGLILVIVFLFIRYKKREFSVSTPGFVTAIALLYMLALRFSLGTTAYLPENHNLLFIAVLFLMIPIYTSSLRFIMHRLPHSLTWICLVVPLVFLIVFLPKYNLSNDTTYTVFDKITRNTFSSDDGTYPSLLHYNGTEWDSIQESTVIQWYDQCMKHLTPQHFSMETLNPVSKNHLARMWGTLGELCLTKSKKPINNKIKLPWQNMALRSFIYAYELDHHSWKASLYTDRIASIAGKMGNYIHLVNYSIKTIQLNPYHFDANQRLYQINRHMGNQHKSLNYLRRMMKSRPDSLEIRIELVRCYLDYNFPHHARLNYDITRKEGLIPLPELEIQLPPSRKTRWIPRNPLIIH
ncbi:hypothetical protein JW835_00630 [bacterium]|nr:hypothetical protein [bacterium]